ncbi:hypothetical protein Tco_0665137 [Tanacetum coccineum]
MTGNMSYLTDFEEIDRGYVAFGGNPKGGKITSRGTKACDDAGKARMKIVPGKDYILLPLWPADPPFSQSSKCSPNAGFKPLGDNEKKVTKEPRKEGGDPSKENENYDQEKDDDVNNTNNVNTASDGNNTNIVNVVSSTVNVAGIEVNVVGTKISIELPDDPNMPALEDIVYSDNNEDVGAEADMNNLDAFMPVTASKAKEMGFLQLYKHVIEIFKEIFGFLCCQDSKPNLWKLKKPLLKDKDCGRWMFNLYRIIEMVALMYLTSSRHDILFVRVKKTSLDMKFHNRSCQFLGADRIQSSVKADWVTNSIIEAEYVAALSCCGQFWSNVNEKTVNGEVQLQALVDGKKIVVTKASVRRDLQLEDANGVDCLPNATFFEQLTLIWYEKLSQKLTFCKEFFSPQWKFLIHTILQCLNAKTTAWNEFSSTIASAIICLATNQKFNFSKCIFKSMMKNLDNAVKFLIVLDLEITKTAQVEEITSLKKRVKRLENKEDASKQGRKTDDIDAGAKITLVDENQGRHDDDLIFDKGVLNDKKFVIRTLLKGTLEQESSKKQKVDDDKETEELKLCMEIISDDRDDVIIEATPLSTKSPTIVNYKMLKNFDREDLEVLWSIVKARFKKTEPMNYMEKNFYILI